MLEGSSEHDQNLQSLPSEHAPVSVDATMSFGGKRVDNASASPLKRFVSESQLEAQQREKEAAWQAVRAAAGGNAQSSTSTVRDSGDSEPAYDPNDTRTLYERLNSHKQNKQLAYDEAHKLKNQLSVIDTEEAEFLEHVDRVRERELLDRQREQDEILKDLRQNALAETEKSLEVKRAALLGTPAPPAVTALPSKSSVSNKLASLRLAVKKKTSFPEQKPGALAKELLPAADAGAKNSDAEHAHIPSVPNEPKRKREVDKGDAGVAKVVAMLPSLVPAYTGTINVNKHASEEDAAAGDDSDSSDSSNGDRGAPAASFSLLSKRRKTDLAMIKRRKRMRGAGCGNDADDGACEIDADDCSDDE